MGFGGVKCLRVGKIVRFGLEWACAHSDAEHAQRCLQPVVVHRICILTLKTKHCAVDSSSSLDGACID